MEPSSVLITGASSGLGRGLAVHYARSGATVHALGRRAAELEALAREAVEAGVPGRVVPRAIDVCDTEALAAAIEAAQGEAAGRSIWWWRTPAWGCRRRRAAWTGGR